MQAAVLWARMQCNVPRSGCPDHLHLLLCSDDLEKNSKFAKEQRLPFPLLCDQGSFLRKSFGIKGDLLGLLPGRQVSQLLLPAMTTVKCNFLWDYLSALQMQCISIILIGLHQWRPVLLEVRPAG